MSAEESYERSEPLYEDKQGNIRRESVYGTELQTLLNVGMIKKFSPNSSNENMQRLIDAAKKDPELNPILDAVKAVALGVWQRQRDDEVPAPILKLREEENDQKKKLIMLPKGQLVSDFAREVIAAIRDKDVLFVKNNEAVEIQSIKEKNKVGENTYQGFVIVEGQRFIGIAERFVTTYWVTKYEKDEAKTMTVGTAQIILQSDAVRNDLKSIQRIFTAPIPILMDDMLLLPNVGHDERFDSWLVKNAPVIDKKMSIMEAKEIIDFIYKEFCFKDNQSKTNAIAHLLSEFCQGIYSGFNVRTPVFFYEANRERAGKDYCAVIPSLVFEGTAMQDPPIATGEKFNNGSDELRKKITTMLKNGRRRFHSSNNRGNISNECFEMLATTEYWADRVLGGNTEVKMSNELFLSLSANVGYTSTPDFVNRCRFIRLHLAIEDANKRVFENSDLHQWIKNNRGKILSSLYVLVREWHLAGMPPGETTFTSYPEWARIVGGIMTFTGLGDPCLAAEEDQLVEADSETADMKRLFELMYKLKPGVAVTKRDVSDIISMEDELNLFADIFGKAMATPRSTQTAFAMMFKKYVGRIFSGIILKQTKKSSNTTREEYTFTLFNPAGTLLNL